MPSFVSLETLPVMGRCRMLWVCVCVCGLIHYEYLVVFVFRVHRCLRLAQRQPQDKESGHLFCVGGDSREVPKGVRK